MTGAGRQRMDFRKKEYPGRERLRELVRLRYGARSAYQARVPRGRVLPFVPPDAFDLAVEDARRYIPPVVERYPIPYAA